MRSIRAFLIFGVAASCAVGERQPPPGANAADGSADPEAGSIAGKPGADAGDEPDAASAADASKKDGAGGGDAGSGTDGGNEAGSGIDPDVVLPDPSGAPCSPPGSTVACGGVRACRLASPTGGRCDDCNPQGTCSGLVTTACTQSLDCDINLQCFRGKCTLFCMLNPGTECGKPGICIDVGHPTVGLCDPWQLW